MAQNKTSKKTCPVTVVAELLSDTWTMLVVHNLIKGQQMRFCELERALAGISTRTLTLKLKKLEDKQLINKTNDGYRITKTGLKLQPVIRAMEQFGKSLA